MSLHDAAYEIQNRTGKFYEKNTLQLVRVRRVRDFIILYERIINKCFYSLPTVHPASE